MIAEPDAAAALATVPGWDPRHCRIRKLGGGLTNRVYLVRSEDRECILRLDSTITGIAPDRRRELEIIGRAGEAGIAPAVLYVNVEAGILVTEYLRGKVWQDRELESHDNLEMLAGLLRRVHALPPCGSRFDLERYARNYRETITGRPELEPFASYCVRVVQKRSPRDTVACCHNDIVASNVIEFDGLRLIDWEYAGDNDPLFDLASLIGYHDLDQDRQRVLLGAYAGVNDAELAERLADEVRVFDAVQWLWLAARQSVAPGRDQAQRLETIRARID